MLKRVSGLLTGLLRDQHVMFIRPDSYQNAIETVIKKMGELYPELANEHILSELLTRELAFPTTLAHGVAAPHLHCFALTEPICFLAHISKEIELRTYEGEPVKLLFALLSQESEPELHLRILAEIATITSTPEKVQSLMKAKTSGEFFQLVKVGKTDTQSP
ncbi:PTS sugar transporter subunit IIA [bacterium]|nr:PTS sugar transporter subunit IIA [bacterium]